MNFRLYRAFGLDIKSPIELPDFLVQSGKKFDVEISIKEKLRKKLTANWFFKEKDNKILIYFREVGLFKIKKGKILFYSDKGSLIKYVHLYLSGLVFGAYLVKCGYEVIHASAILNSKGKIIMFVGMSGAGKSSIVAGLIKEGLSLVSDDVVALNSSDRNFVVKSGKIRLQLTEEVANMLFGNSLKKDKNPFKNKYFLYQKDEQEKSGKLAAIYFLEHGNDISIKEASKAAALFKLLQNNLKSRFLKSQPEQLNFYGELVEEIPCFSLKRSNELGNFFATQKLLLSHMAKNNLL